MFVLVALVLISWIISCCDPLFKVLSRSITPSLALTHNLQYCMLSGSNKGSTSLQPFLFNNRVHTGPWKPRKSLNLKIWIRGLESPGIFVEVLESPGIWTYRSMFLIISIQEFSRYTSSEIWVYLCALKRSLNFTLKGPGKSCNLRCQNVYEPWIING